MTINDKEEFRKLVFFSVLLAGTLLFFRAVLFYDRAHVGFTLTEISKPFEIHPHIQTKRVLFMGDSTAEGTGALDPRGSTAGHLNAEFPKVDIVNTGQDGAVVSQVRDQLTEVDGYFDLIVIQAGANDIMKLIPLEDTQDNMRLLINDALSLSENVVFLIGGNVGASPIFPLGLDRFYSYRSNELRKRYATLEGETNAHFVDLFRSVEDLRDLGALEQYFSPDGLHLNEKGYGVWYRIMKETLAENGNPIEGILN